jgi:UDP-2,3-diacylglucosamine pyrophosphatase LpxH
MSKSSGKGNRPIFVISDLHMGDGGPRDNFSHDQKEEPLHRFLDHVGEQNGELVLLGDLFELWKANLGRVLVKRRKWLDRFRELEAVYVIGNHDAQLEALIGSDLLSHGFFSRMTGPFNRTIGGKKFRFLHGHETDPSFRDGNPGWANIMTIFRGIIEDRKGSPLLAEGGATEKMWLKVGTKFLWIWNAYAKQFDRRAMRSDVHRIESELTPSQNPKRIRGMIAQYKRERQQTQADVIISGHTHIARSYRDWYFNSGCWIGACNNFLRIQPDGNVELYDWKNGNPIVLPAKKQNSRYHRVKKRSSPA